MNYMGIIRKINGRDVWGFGALLEGLDTTIYSNSNGNINIAVGGDKEPHILYETSDNVDMDNSDVSLNADSIKKEDTSMGANSKIWRNASDYYMAKEIEKLCKACGYDIDVEAIAKEKRFLYTPITKHHIHNVTTDTYTKTERVKNVDKSTQPYTVTYKDVATEYTKLTIEWVDGTETSVECPTSEYSPYYGFTIAVAKKAMGNDNTMSNLADYWMNKVPKKRKAKEKAIAEKKRIEEKREAERKKRFEHRKAKKLMMDRVRAYKEYEADMKIRKEAYEKYGVPEGFNIPKDNE